MYTKTILPNHNAKASFAVAAMLTMPMVAFAVTNSARPTESPNMTRSATVSLADLDLTTPAGLNAARDRVNKTARHLCSSVSDPLDLSHHANYVICVDEAVAGAMLKIAQSPEGQRNSR